MTEAATQRPPDVDEETPEDPKPTAPPDPPAHPEVEPVVIPRWIQAVVLPLGLLALFALARAAKQVVLLFLIAGVIALVLNPLVKLMNRRHIPRGVAVLVVYLGFFAALVGIGVLLANPVSDQIQRFQKDVPHIVKDANSSLANFQHWLDQHGIGVHIKKPGQTALETIQKNVLKGSGSIVSFTRDLVSKLVTLSFALVLILVLSVYMLLSAEGIGRITRAVMPPGDGTPEDDFALRIQRAVFSYVRGQALFSLIMGSSAAVCLYIFGVLGIFPDGENYAVFFGAFYGLMEFIPYVGPVIGAVPPILVALFQDPISAIWVALLFITLQQIEGHVVAPQVFGHSLRINPLLVIAALLIGEALYGIIGALVALPIAAVVRETVVYLRQHTVLEKWEVHRPPRPPPAGGGGGEPGG